MRDAFPNFFGKVFLFGINAKKSGYICVNMVQYKEVYTGSYMDI